MFQESSTCSVLSTGLLSAKKYDVVIDDEISHLSIFKRILNPFLPWCLVCSSLYLLCTAQISAIVFLQLVPSHSYWGKMLVGEGSGKCICRNKDILMRKTVNSDEEIPEGKKVQLSVYLERFQRKYRSKSFKTLSIFPLPDFWYFWIFVTSQKAIQPHVALCEKIIATSVSKSTNDNC